jgi:hypothetical protein
MEGDAGRASALEGATTEALPIYRPAGGRGSPLDRTEALVPRARLTQAQRDAMPTKTGLTARGSPVGEPA